MELKYNGSGRIFYKEHEYKCDLYINENQGGIMTTVSVEKVFADFLELPFEIEFLSGELSNGFRFSLMNCTRQGMQDLVSENRSVFTYFVQYMFKGVGGKECKEIRFYKVNFGLSAIMEWGEISGYTVGENYELLSNNEIETEVYADERITIKYIVTSSLLPVGPFELLKEKIILSQNGNIEITLKKEDSINEFYEILKKIKRLIELSVLRQIYINEITGWTSDIFDEYEQKRIKRPIEIVGGEIKKEELKSSSVHTWKWITLPELIKNGSFAYFFAKYELLQPIIELYIEIIYSRSISNIRSFLNIVQALETYHSRFKTNDIEEFRSRIYTVILKDRPESCIKRDTEFLMANSRRFITLESRMADLLLAEFQLHFDTGDIRYLDFPNVIAKTRNYYIHYDEKIKDNGRVLTEEELSIYNHALMYILEYYLLIELGFSDVEQIREKLNKRWGSVSTELSLVKISKEREKMRGWQEYYV